MTKKLHPVALTRLTHADFGQFIHRFLDDLDKSGLRYNTDESLVALVNQLKTQLPVYKKSLEQVRASDKTKSIAQADKERDDDLQALQNALKAFRSTKRPNEAEAYTSLNLLFKQYKEADSRNYEAQTLLVATLLEKLATAPYQAQVTLLGLKRFVDSLAESNAAFEAIYASRSKDQLTKVSYDVKELRSQLQFTYQLVADYINITAQVKSLKLYKDLLGVVNNSRKAYADILARTGKREEKAQETDTTA